MSSVIDVENNQNGVKTQHDKHCTSLKACTASCQAYRGHISVAFFLQAAAVVYIAASCVPPIVGCQ
jgi:hypothetical protein